MFDPYPQATFSDTIPTTLSNITIPQTIVQRKAPKIEFVGLKISPEVSEFLNNNPSVTIRMCEITDKVNNALGLDIVPQLEIIHDEESDEFSKLAFVYGIQGKTYDDLLKIWDDVAEQVYTNLDLETSKRISIVLDTV
ncbi:MAG: hypothetical protein KGI02_07750 [Thaumarchaeota archaeon]|nr:hypothetical protein [Nitrososphaerota archaeon]MDE1841091.1 hypothetical protein [Nitrososphaerota archaeon]